VIWINTNDEITNHKSVFLKGWVSYFLYFKFGMKKTVIEFFLENKKIGETETDQNGFFELEYEFENSGVFKIKTQIQNMEYFFSFFHILVLEKDNRKQALVCDVDNTIVDFSYWLLLTRSQFKEIQGAEETLKILSEHYHIIYLTHREERFSCFTKQWFDLHSLPAGPIIFWSSKDYPIANQKYKNKALADLIKKTGLKLAAGIGDKKSDIAAYQKNGIKKTFLLKEPKDWEKIREALII